ncbi:MAG: homoprotocatechuate degradation operon regulator HpaR [Beijerinckiaceae bacterium]|jgi:homoprotocatechuate degradation regulator HpaR|nr:homoprotocatechuate degradation operon regulator HpaR [Beijerinckiaceae bacterium]
MRSLEQSLPLKLLRAREAVMDHFRPHLHTHGVTEQQWRVLRALAEFGDMDAGTLAQRVCLLMPSLSRILRDLTAADLLLRSRKVGDGRMVIVSLSSSGRRLFERMSVESEQIYAALASAIGRKRLDELAGDLENLVTILDALPVQFSSAEKNSALVRTGSGEALSTIS